MLPSHVLERLKSADWERIFPALVAYAVARTRRLPFVKGGGELPQGHQPHDVAREAVRLVYEGERQWNPSKHPDLARYLSGVVSSLVSNLITSADHVQRVDGLTDEPVDMDAFEETGILSPVDAVASDECIGVPRALVDRVTAGDEQLAEVSMGLEEGMQFAEIADLFSMEVREVYSLSQKLRRRLLSAMAGHECWEDHPVMATASRP